MATDGMGLSGGDTLGQAAPKVSVVVPFYKVEAFIGRCVQSLMGQTLREVEFLFVDDASPDGSREIVSQMIGASGRDARILVHEKNKGLPAARNTGIEAARGEFIYHCDSDDYVEPTLLEELYRAAKDAGADYTYCDFFLDFGTGRRRLSNPDYTEPERLVKEGFLAGQMKYNVWNKLVSRTCYENPTPIRFPAGHGMGEDMTMILLAMRAHRCAQVPRPLYHYMQTNEGSFVHAALSTERLDDIRFNANRVFDALDQWPVEGKARHKAFFQLNLKLPFLLSGSLAQYRLWRQLYPEANPYIAQNTLLPFRTRMVQHWAARGLYPLVKLYSLAIGLFYRLVAKQQAVSLSFQTHIP